MKMAKASEADLEMAMELSNALDALTGRWGAVMPEKIERLDGDSEQEWFDPSDADQCIRVVEYLRELAYRASLMRVVWGMAVLLDPKNRIVDPDADTLEHHPIASAALEAADAAAAAPQVADRNWESLQREVMPLIGRQFRSANGNICRLIGLIDGGDDYYYGMTLEGRLHMLSCVGSLEVHGMTLIEP